MGRGRLGTKLVGVLCLPPLISLPSLRGGSGARRGRGRPGSRSPHPVSPRGPSVLSGEAGGLKPRALILPPAKPGLRGHPRGAGCPGDSRRLGPWWGRDGSSARKVQCPVWPHLAATWARATSHPALECTLPSLTSGLSGADSSPRSSPCQIVLNYNDKPWQASMATSQQKERDKHPTSCANKLHSRTRRS